MIRKSHTMPKLLNRSCQMGTLMPVSQAMDDPELITVSDDPESPRPQVFLSSERTAVDTPLCYFELTELKALAASFVMAVIAAASVILAIKTLGFSAAVQYGCGCIGGAGTFFLGRLAFNNAPANVQVMRSAGRWSEPQSEVTRELKSTNSSLDEISGPAKQLPHLLKDYAGLLKM